MAQLWARPFYNSKQWITCREAYKQSVNGLCERCLEDNRYAPGYEVHHKTYLTPSNINDPNVTLSWENLELLCLSCHSIEHNRMEKEVVREGLMFDGEGNLVKVGVKP